MHKLEKGVKYLLQEAMNHVASLEVSDAQKLLSDSNVQFIDVRDPNEWDNTGMINNAVGISRGMLEFVVDPDSAYYNPAIDPTKRLVLYCARGPRSALAAWRLKKMGFEKVYYLDGGLDAWLELGGEINEGTEKQA